VSSGCSRLFSGGSVLNVRTASIVVLGLGFWQSGAPAAEQAPDTIAARVLACAPCHGDKGQGTENDYFPRLAGKPSGYLYNQLIAFRRPAEVPADELSP
jgi:cytochrome c553